MPRSIGSRIPSRAYAPQRGKPRRLGGGEVPVVKKEDSKRTSIHAKGKGPYSHRRVLLIKDEGEWNVIWRPVAQTAKEQRDNQPMMAVVHLGAYDTYKAALAHGKRAVRDGIIAEPRTP